MRALSSIFLLYCCALCGQQPSPNLPSFSDQQILRIFNGIKEHEARIEPMLQQIRPADWIAKGAPDAYTAQYNTVQQQLAAIQTDMSDLAQHPDRMTDCMKALFRARAFHDVLNSLMGGLRKYQNPALADLIESVAAEDRVDLNQLEQYILELAIDRDQQFAVMDREAQRCRAILSKQPAQPGGAARRVQ